MFSYVGETVLDPFMGSGTTLKVALELGRNAVGYEIDVELLDTVKKRLRIDQTTLSLDSPFEIIVRDDAELRTWQQEKIKKQRSVAQKW